jgi:hypothetical protein
MLITTFVYLRLWLRHGTVAEAADLQLPPGAVTVGWLDTASGAATSATIISSSEILYGVNFPDKSP